MVPEDQNNPTPAEDVQAPAESTPAETPAAPTPQEPATPATTTPVEEETPDVSTPDAQGSDESAPTGSETEPQAEPEVPAEDPTPAPEIPVSGQVNPTTDTTAGNTVPEPGTVVQVTSTNQSDEVRQANLGGQNEERAPARPVGTLVPQKSVEELEDEIDSGAFKDIVEFVKKHWEARDANIQLMAKVLRMEIPEIYTILREDLHVQLPQGM